MTRETDHKARTSKKDFKRGRSLSPPTGRLASPSVISVTDPFRKPGGISWFVAALFLVDDLGGGGLVTLPTAMVRTDFYIGFVIFLLLMGVTMYSAYALGQCWNILLNTWSIYRVHCRKPYASIGYRAMGPRVRKLVSLNNDFTQFGVTVIYLLLAAKNIHDMVKTFTDTEFSYCFVILILAACLLPVTYLKSPEDFWIAVMIAMFTTAAAVTLVILGISLDYGLCSGYTGVPPLRVKNFFVCLGTVIFACGGHAAFPTIQHDMKNPGDYSKSVFTAFTLLLLLYSPITILGYLTYHDSIRDSILPSIQTEWMRQASNVLITIHCILTITIVINPLNQDLEDLFHCPHHFGWQRVLLRTGTMLAIVFVGESIPSFGPILDLIGGSTQTLASVIFPVLFYVHLLARQKKAEECDKDDDSPPSLRDVLKYAPRKTLILCVCIAVLGIIGGAAATFSAVIELSTTRFSLPCYVNLFIDEKNAEDTTASVYCCGAYQNITHNGRTDQCVPMPKIPFYS
ncbi:hypothetical protein V3C99_010146 [Haemonchus contortus]